MISIKLDKTKHHPIRNKMFVRSNPLVPLIASIIITTIYIVAHINSTKAHFQEQQPHIGEQQFAKPNHSNPCPKQWLHFSQKCYRIVHTPRNYENAKSKCKDWGSQLTLVGDDSPQDSSTIEDKETNLFAKEKETNTQISSGKNSIISFLSNDQRKVEQARQYWVNLSSMLKQSIERQQNGYNQEGPVDEGSDHMESDSADPGLWLPRDDWPADIAILSDKIDSNSSFVLAYSSRHKKWGLVPVSPTKKMSYICEREQQLHHTTPSVGVATSQHDARRGSQDLSGRTTNDSPSYSIINPRLDPLESRKVTEKQETTTSPQPDTTSMLFRDVPQDQSVVLGTTAEMRCSPSDIDTSLNWTFNGRNLTQQNRIRVHTNGTLKIEHVRNTDDGTYNCTLQSGGISESKVARLIIIERPHQPEYITAELLDKLSTSVRIKWTPGFNGNSPIKKYQVEMRTLNSDENEMSTIMHSNSWEVAKANISADQTSVIIPDLKPARKYIFRIKATNRVGTGEPSFPTKPIEVPVQPPSMPPENLSGTPKSSTSISVQWMPPPVDSQNGVLKGYKIRHKLEGYASDSEWYTNDVQDAARLTFLLEDLIIWQTYEIQVAAENDKGVGPFSSSIYVRTKEGKPVKGPRNVVAKAVGPTTISIDWAPPPPQHINGLNQGYKVKVWYDMHHTSLAKELTVPHNLASPNHTVLIDGLLPYTEYHLTVECYTNAGDGPPSEDNVVVKTKQDLPEAVPILEFADVLDKSLRVLWKAPNRINGELDHYTLEYSEASSSDKKILKNYPASATEARIVDLVPQTSYNFKIFPHTNVGQGPGKANNITTSVPPVLPEPPTNLICSNIGPNSVTIEFNPGFDGNANIEKWNAEALTPMRGEYAPRWQTIYVSTNHSQGNLVVVRNLRPFTRYRIRLTPINVVGSSRQPSEPTTEFQTAQVEPEQPPRDFVVEEVKSTSAIAHWSPLSNNLWLGNPRGYNITWTESNNSTTMHHLINDTRASSYLIKDLEEFTEYSFRIHAVNEVGLSPSSEPISATTLEDVPSSGPTNLTAHAISSNTVSINWNGIPKRHRNGIIKGYKIQYQALKPADAPLQYKIVDDNSTKHVALNELKPFTAYQLAVAAFTVVGDGVYSAVLHVQTFEDTPGTPQNLSTPTVSQTSIRILWDPPENPNGDITGYKVSYHALVEGNKEVATHELHQNERTFKATNLKPDTHYLFTVAAKTKEGWGQQASTLTYTYDSELRANLPFFKESWFVILCASLSVVITITVTALLFIQTKSYKYKQDAKKSTSQDQLGDAGFTIDDDTNHYNNGFGLSHGGSQHRRSNGALSQSTANFTLPKSPPRPHPGSVVYSDDGDDDVFGDIVDKRVKGNNNMTAGPSNYDSSGDSLTDKPSGASSSTAPESESADDEYVNMAERQFANHYANVNGTMRSQKAWKPGEHYSNQRFKPKLPQRPAPSVPKVPCEPSSSSSDNAPQQPVPETSNNNVYGESPQASFSGGANHNNLNGGRIIVNNMAGSRAPLPGFTSSMNGLLM